MGTNDSETCLHTYQHLHKAAEEWRKNPAKLGKSLMAYCHKCGLLKTITIK